MEMIKGLFSNMVLQRNKENVCEGDFSLKTSKKGVLKVYVSFEGVEFPCYSIITRRKTSEYEINACLKGLPAGGPYEIKLSIENDAGKTMEHMVVKNVLVGDVWILAGQSNMEGVGYMKYALKPHPMTRAFYMTDKWGIAKDPLHFLNIAVDDVHTKVIGCSKEPSHIGVGPGIPYSQEMYKLSGVPQGLISCAHGGTTMSQWDPGLKDLGGNSLYGAMYRRFVKNGGRIAGVLWYQGCSDALWNQGCSETDENAASLYTSRMIEFVKAMRKDFGNSKLPVVAVQISRVCNPDGISPKYWNDIQEQQRLLPSVIRNFSVVPAIDLSLDDDIHISGYDQIRLGKRLSQAMSVLTSNDASFLPPIKLKSVKKEIDKYNKCINIIISYDNVMGKLEAPGRPSGFFLINRDSALNALLIYRIDLLDNKVIIKTNLSLAQIEKLVLYYGFGVDPYCNITDSNDRSIPVMGPMGMID